MASKGGGQGAQIRATRQSSPTFLDVFMNRNLPFK
jgi:hypothetical protein